MNVREQDTSLSIITYSCYHYVVSFLLSPTITELPSNKVLEHVQCVYMCVRVFVHAYTHACPYLCTFELITFQMTLFIVQVKFHGNRHNLCIFDNYKALSGHNRRSAIKHWLCIHCVPTSPWSHNYQLY